MIISCTNGKFHQDIEIIGWINKYSARCSSCWLPPLDAVQPVRAIYIPVPNETDEIRSENVLLRDG